MKAIIFDLDNTLINWLDEFIMPLKVTIKEYIPNISEDKIKEIDNVIDNNDKYLAKLTKENFLNYINKNTNLNLPITFVEKLLHLQEKCVYEDNDLVDTIKYLASKYDLYVITNYFEEVQKKRLDNMHILKYFKGVYGGDNNYLKPNLQAFQVILDKYDSKECTYIGDNFDFDIMPALRANMNVIWKTNNDSEDYQTIKEIKALKNIL